MKHQSLDFQSELQSLINRHSVENGSDTPDYLLASYLCKCLLAYQEIVNQRDKWFGVDMWSKNKLLQAQTTNEATIGNQHEEQDNSK